jgi:hypothetical protein
MSVRPQTVQDSSTDRVDDDNPYVEAYIGYVPRAAPAPTGTNLNKPGDPSSQQEQRLCRIYDGWAYKEELSLHRQGFVAVKHKTKFGTERDREKFRAGYPDEMIDLVLQLSGASWVLPKRVDIVFRASVQSEGQDPVGAAAHADYTPRSVRTQGELVLGLNAQEGRPFRRVADYQTWRALTPPPQDRPLAVCDGRTIRQEDRIALPTVIGREDDPAKVFESTLARYSPDHRWFYFPNMEQDDLLIFRGADTDLERDLNVFHSAFLDPSGGTRAVPRESIESRFFCYYE